MNTIIPDWILKKWQNIADLIADLINVPAALIMKLDEEHLEVFVSSKTENNPYSVGNRGKMYGLYCEAVIKSQNKLLIPNALKNKNWDKNPDIKLGMIAYLGYPINYPDKTPFGTICVLDRKENNFTDTQDLLLLQFRDVIENDLMQIQTFDISTKKHSKTIQEQHQQLKDTNKSLQDNKMKLHAILDHHFQLTGLIDIEGRLLHANKTALEFSEVEESDVLGKYFWDCLWWDRSQESEVRSAFDRAVKGEFVRFETTHLNFDGEIRNVDFSFNPVCDDNGKVNYIVPEGYDITQHKQDEHKLIESEKKFRSLFESANDGIAIFQGNKIVECNPKVSSLFGFENNNEIIGLTSDNLSPEKQPDGSCSKVKGKEYFDAAFKGIPQIFNWRHKRKGGSEFDAEVSLNAVLIEEEVQIQAILRDRTKELIAEKAMRSSEEKFSKVFNNNPLPISITSIPEGKYVDVNPMFEKISGFKKDEIIGKNIFELGLYVNPDDHIKILQELQEEGKLTDYEVTFQIKSGEYHFCRLFSEIVKFQNVPYVLSMIYDDTDRKRAEQAELESTKRYKELLELLPEAVFETDKDFNLTYVNQRAFDLFGYSNEDIAKGINGLNIIAPADRDRAKENIAMRAQGDEHGAVEYQAIKKDGSTFPVLIHVSSILKDGKIAGILGILIDISERKKAEYILHENEKKYRTLFESANDGILIIKDNKIVECNSKGLSIFGFDNKKEIIGITPSDLSPERQPDGRYTKTHEKENLINVIKGIPQRFNWRHYRKGGNLFDAEVSLNTILLEGKPHVQAIVRDITEQIQAELKLKESEARFKRLFEDLGDAVYVTVLGGENMGQILEANPAAVRQTGYSRSELIDMNIIKELYVSGTSKLNSEEWEGKINAGEIITSVEKKRRKDGTKFWTEVLITPIFFKGQKACLSINRDITKRIKTEQNLKKALQKAEESDRLKSAFLASMSHEIRTPLNAIIGFSSLIADSVKDPQLSEFSLLINKQNDLLLKLVNDILEFATIESESLSINYEVFDLNKLIDDLLLTMYSDLKQDTELIPQKMRDSLIVNSDQHRIKQVFTNLIINALKFTQKGAVTFGYEMNNESEIKCFVKDTGIGIHKDQQKRIFERFIKLNSFSQGTGLGLSISKNIIKIMGGKIWVESELGKGSIFHFTIPVKKVEKETGIIELLDSNTNSIDEITKEGKLSSILIAEDNMVNFLYVKNLLGSSNINIMHASNGVEAVEHVKKNDKLDLILMDIKMPLLNGYEATRIIKQIKPQLPIIALTAYALPEDKLKAKDAGCNDYISKPINKTELFALIYKHFKK